VTAQRSPNGFGASCAPAAGSDVGADVGAGAGAGAEASGNLSCTAMTGSFSGIGCSFSFTVGA
jgi:hypothetical protein